MKTVDVFKIQVPLKSTDPKPKALVYNERRTIQFEMWLSPEILKVMKGRPKAYFVCEYFPEAARLDIAQEADDQEPGW
jgi:hypothetical protein